MFKSLFDSIMDRRSTQLLEQMDEWLPQAGSIIDIGSGTGHFAERAERERGADIVPTDVVDIHVTGKTPILISDDELPFADDTHAAALMLFMLHYPANPVGLLAEVSRVTRGPVIIVQSLYSGAFGYTWLRCREFVWTYVAFHLSRLIRYVPQSATFSMNARRFYSADVLEQHANVAGLRITEKRSRALLPFGMLAVGTWKLERDATIS